MKYKLLLTEPVGFSQEARDILESFCDVVERSSEKNNLEREIIDFDILFVRLGITFDRKILNLTNRLKYIVSPTTGLDHIDLLAAKEFGINVLSLQGETFFLREISATAELAWGLLLSLVRNIPGAFDDVKNGGWNRDLFKGNELSGKRLGILGLGRLGEKVADYGSAFGMKVMAYDPYREGWKSNVERAVSLDQLLVNADILSIHLPLNLETEGLLGDHEIGLMPGNSWIINTSRGKVLDEDALLHHLETGHLAGAGLDVLTNELEPGVLAKNKLIQYSQRHDNLIISPHIGRATIESMQKTEVFMAKKLWENLFPQDYLLKKI